MIPGTHNSGSYDKPGLDPFTTQYTTTQDMTILEQLIFGARYFDLRPKYREEKHDFWVSHGPIDMHPIQDIVDDVRTFLDNTNEIVILSFKEFIGKFA